MGGNPVAVEMAMAAEMAEGVRKAAHVAGASIFTVPESLRKLKESAYTPRLFSIGPLHSGDSRLQTPEIRSIKLSYLNSLLFRLSYNSHGHSDHDKKYRVLGECLHEMENSIETAKECYADAEKAQALSKEMLVIDGCFILEFLYRFVYLIEGVTEPQLRLQLLQARAREKFPDDPIFNSSAMGLSVLDDLLLLENQLPWFVLEKLFELTVKKIPKPVQNPEHLRQYLYKFFEKKLKFKRGSTSAYEPAAAATSSCHHILHLLHAYYFPRGLSESKANPINPVSESAADLDFAGVKFVPAGEDQFNVRFTQPTGIMWWFRRARFEIPSLPIHDSTELVLRNLIALEQCCPGVPVYMTSYAHLMDSLVNTEEDVKMLEKEGVIRNYLGSRPEAANLFNNLGQQVVIGEFYFGETYKEAAQYTRGFWPKLRAHVTRRYLANPYSFIALAVGLIYFLFQAAAFVLAIANSFYTSGD